MNVKELIEKYKRYEGKWNGKTGELARQIFLEDLKQLDEPQPVKVKQFVADWIEYFKKCSGTLYGSTVPFSYYGRAIADDFEGDVTEALGWIRDNSEVYARAWLDGYEVEKEKRYRVKFKGFNSSYIILKHHHYDNTWFLGGEQEYEFYRTKHTRKQLEDADFGWVFDCDGVEVTEVE